MRSRRFYGLSVCVLIVARRVLWCRKSIALFVPRVSGQVLGTSVSILCSHYNNDSLFLTLDQDPNGLDFASRHPTCFYGTEPKVSTSKLQVRVTVHH